MNLNNTDFLSMEEIKAQAPSIFTTKASPDVSKNYTHIPTNKVIEDMQVLGWGVVDATEVKSRKKIGFQKHLVVFRNENISIEGEDGDVVYPQILLTNSHDGKNSFKFTAGLYRLVCSNGLVISTETFDNVKIRHMGYTFEELQDKIHAMVERLPLTVESMNQMKEIKLNQNAIVDFAKKAIEVRFSKDETKRISIDYQDLIQPIRKADEGQDLWSVFNVIQEKLIHGDFMYTSGDGKSRKARRIKNFQQDQKINQDLFKLALELVK